MQRSKDARNFQNGRQQKYPDLDFDRNQPNTGIRLLVGVPSCLKNLPKFEHFWSYFLGITYVTRFLSLCPHSSFKFRYEYIGVYILRIHTVVSTY